MSIRQSEVTRGAGPVTNWTPMTHYGQYTAYANSGSASPLDDVTIQLRKATSAGGANATNFGSPVTAKVAAALTGLAADLGQFSAGVPFTHVSAVVADEASPNTVTSYAVLSNPDFTGAKA